MDIKMVTVEDVLKLNPEIFKSKKILFIILNDNISDVTDFIIPSLIENIEFRAKFVSGIPIDPIFYERIKVINGKFTHIFEIYKDNKYQNIDYLIQKLPIRILNPNTTKILKTVKKNTLIKLIPDPDKITFLMLSKLATEICNYICDKYDLFIFVRFQNNDKIEETFATGIFSRDVYSLFIDTFDTFFVEKMSTDIPLYTGDESMFPFLSILLFIHIPKGKMYYDIVFATSDIITEEDGVKVLKMPYEEYASKLLDEIVSAYGSSRNEDIKKDF